MKMCLIAVFLLLLPSCTESEAWMGPIMTGGGVESGEANATLGETTYSALSDVNSSYTCRCSKYTASSSFTATSGYWYAEVVSTATAGTFKLAVYEDDGGSPDTASQVGDCSSEGVLPENPDWNEVTFSPGLSIVSSTVYWICHFSSKDPHIWYDTPAGGGTYQEDTTCGLAASGSGSTTQPAMFVANYQDGGE